MAKKIRKEVTIKDKTFKQGDLVMAKINGLQVVGRLHFSDKSVSSRYADADTVIHLCQNNTSGSNQVRKFGYKYSWVFSHKDGAIRFSDGVTLISVLSNEKLDTLIFNINNTTYLAQTLDGSITISFNFSGYPSCCGSKIIHNYSTRYTEVPTDTQLYLIKKSIQELSPFLSMIVVNGDQGHSFFTEYLGFKEQEHFKNYNDRGAHLIMLTYTNPKGEI